MTWEQRTHTILNVEQKLCENQNTKHQQIIIYTDGSKMPNGVGAAWFRDEETYEQYKLPSEASIFTAEAFAIREALQYIKQNTLHNCTILTDSLSVVMAILHNNSVTKENWLITNIKLQMIELWENNITINWIKGHNNNIGNEKVDQLAKEAIIKGKYCNILLPGSDLKPIIYKSLMLEWNNNWTQYTKHHSKHYGRLQTNTPLHNRSWTHKAYLPRHMTTTIIRLRMGPAQTPNYLYKIKQQEHPNCSCGEDGNIDHYLLGCTQHKNNTDIFYNNITRLKIPLPINSSFILSETKLPILKALSRRIVRCKMKI